MLNFLLKFKIKFEFLFFSAELNIIASVKLWKVILWPNQCIANMCKDGSQRENSTELLRRSRNWWKPLGPVASFEIASKVMIIILNYLVMATVEGILYIQDFGHLWRFYLSSEQPSPEVHRRVHAGSHKQALCFTSNIPALRKNTGKAINLNRSSGWPGVQQYKQRLIQTIFIRPSSSSFSEK